MRFIKNPGESARKMEPLEQNKNVDTLRHIDRMQVLQIYQIRRVPPPHPPQNGENPNSRKKSIIHNGGAASYYIAQKDLSIIEKTVGWDQRPGRVEK
jgi:hypothetical protein